MNIIDKLVEYEMRQDKSSSEVAREIGVDPSQYCAWLRRQQAGGDTKNFTLRVIEGALDFLAVESGSTEAKLVEKNRDLQRRLDTIREAVEVEL